MDKRSTNEKKNYVIHKIFVPKEENEFLPETGGWNLSAVDKQH